MTLTEDLISLYRVDSQVRGLRTRVDNAATTLKVREKQLADLVVASEEVESNIRQLQATIQNLEGESGDFQNRIEKLRVELNAATTDKQYQAILAEMKVIQEQRDVVDEQNISEMDRLEQLTQKLDEIKSKIEDATKVRDLAIEKLQERTEEVKERLEELEGERDVAAKVIPEASLAIFDRVAEDNEGETLAPVLEIDKRRHEYACGACNIEIPYNLVVSLISGSDSIQQCPACYRILYIPETADAAS